MPSLWAIAVQLHILAGPLVMLFYPLYASVCAIESPTKEDDTQWLTYWVLYSFIQLIEFGFEPILVWIPFWYTVKLVGICWLVLPQFNGAAFVYENYVKTYIGSSNAGRSQTLTPRQRQLIEQMSPQARATVSAFISEHGSSAFDSVISKITAESTRKTKSPTSANRHGGSPRAAQPTRYPGSPRAAQPTRYPGSPTWAKHTTYSGRPPSPEPVANAGSPDGKKENAGSPTSHDHSGVSRFDSFREYCREPVKLFKTGLHSLENQRNELRAKTKTNFVT